MSKQHLSPDRSETSDDPGDGFEDSASLPQTYMVMMLNPDIDENTLIWVVEKIRGKRRDGGAELVIFKQPYDFQKVIIIF